ncbi:unnamed protein product [Bursaphelenchus xylophilus]|uniref:(pine wood nematode) hypothetical protein n=1 Tax=Bursaphelenchus xylophilus TaxID=6326 RepID=A0A1I7RYD3_BURXY|nr:unnamed protein product [Bursaphelenchus xylophilus]CAG9085621.1 unnamed protein product [Bursaphelenchus xylophilus]
MVEGYEMTLDPREFHIYGLLNPYEYTDLDNIQPTLTPHSCNTINKRNSSAYALFFKEQQASVRKEYPKATFGEVSKIIAVKWESLSDPQKKMYRDEIKDKKKKQLLEKAMEKALGLCRNSF